MEDKVYIIGRVINSEGTKYDIAYNGSTVTVDGEFVWMLHEANNIDERNIRVYKSLKGEVVVASKNKSAYKLRERKDESIGRNHSGNILWSDNRLRSEIDKISKFERRGEVAELINNVMSGNIRSSALVGLRRTGKTVMLLQLSQEMTSRGIKVGFLSAGKGCTMLDVEREADRAVREGARIIIVDEITWTEGFPFSCRNIVGKYNNNNTRLVMAGTDSFQFITAAGDQLFGMISIIETSPVNYWTYNGVKKNSTVMGYIREGGILQSLGHRETYETYIKSAIVDNVYNTLNSLGEWGEQYWSGLFEVYNKGILKNIIPSLIVRDNERKALSALKESFKDSNIVVGLKITQIGQRLNKEETRIIHEGVNSLIGYSRDTMKEVKEANKSDVSMVVYALKKINALAYRRVITEASIDDEPEYEMNFTQFGLRYSTAMRSILGTYKWYIDRIITDKEARRLEEAIKNNIEGHILEDIIAYHLSLKYGEKSVYKCRIQGEKEVDIVVEKVTGKVMIEVKRSDKIYIRKPESSGARGDQIKWLVDRDINNFIEKHPTKRKVVRRIVVYSGKSAVLTREETFSPYVAEYINVDEFMRIIGAEGL